MKQVVQNYKTGEVKLIEAPAPLVKSGGVLVRNVNSVVSLGTEKLMMDFARKSLLGKARARPDLAQKVIELAKAGGIMEAYRQAMNRLDAFKPLGYSSAGVVLEVGEGVEEFKIGDRVACARTGFASHAEIVFVPRNLCAKIPNNVDYESAAFATLGAIPLHAIRLCELSIGDTVGIIGLGLLGQLAVQIAKAAGYRVFGMDTDSAKVALAEKAGMDDGASGSEEVVRRAMNFTKGYGLDAVLILASSTSNQPLEIATEICREKGRIVAPGMVKLDVPRQLFYQKELSLTVSKAWGPGIDDPSYEQNGVDYPYHYVRWTERRNMEQFLDLIKDGKVQLEPLITHRFKIDEAESAYRAITADSSGKYIGVLLCYDTGGKEDLTTKVQLKKEIKKETKEKINVGLIGAGAFATTTMLPIIKKLSSINLRGVATATGASGKHAGDKFGFEYCTTDYKELLKDPEVDCALIATRPNLHARLAVEALKSGKDVFVEKPLALSLSELKEITDAFKGSHARLMVGLNRRFAPLAVKAKEYLGGIREPLIMHYLIDSHAFSKEAVVLDPIEGGGIVRTDWCHLIDLAQFLIGCRPVKLYAAPLRNSGVYAPNENLVVTLTFENGSVAELIWVANGGIPFIRERVEVFGGGIECVINNFRSLCITKEGKKKRKWRLNRDIGHRDELASFFSSIRKGDKSPVDFEEYAYTTLATFCIEESISRGIPVEINPIGIWKSQNEP